MRFRPYTSVSQDQGASQEHVFEEVRPIVEAALEGDNGTIITYGTHTKGSLHILVQASTDKGFYISV